MRSIKATGLEGARARARGGEPLVSIEQPRDRVFSAADATNKHLAQSANAHSRLDVEEKRYRQYYGADKKIMHVQTTDSPEATSFRL